MMCITNYVIRSLIVAVAASSLAQLLLTSSSSVTSRSTFSDDDIVDAVTVPSFEDYESETRDPGEAESTSSSAGELDFPYWIAGTALPW